MAKVRDREPRGGIVGSVDRSAGGGAGKGPDVEATIAFTCAAPAHREGDGGPDKLTIHDRRWAFCPFDALAGGHEWRPSEGLTLSMLQHSSATRPTSGKDATAKDEQRASG
jgi:hypothetical protein